MIEVVMLDLDDTLWDARPALLRAEEAQYAWIARHAPRVTARYGNDELRALRLELARRRTDLAHDFTALRIAALAERLGEFDYDPALAARGVAEFVRVRSTVTLYPEAAATLAELAARYRLVALTNGNTDLEVAGISHYFTVCVTPAEAGVQKPDPRMFEYALGAVGAPAARAVHVGDQPLYDIEGARRAGLRAIWLNRAQAAWPADYARPAAEIARLDALPAALRLVDWE